MATLTHQCERSCPDPRGSPNAIRRPTPDATAKTSHKLLVSLQATLPPAPAGPPLPHELCPRGIHGNANELNAAMVTARAVYALNALPAKACNSAGEKADTSWRARNRIPCACKHSFGSMRRNFFRNQNMPLGVQHGIAPTHRGTRFMLQDMSMTSSSDVRPCRLSKKKTTSRHRGGIVAA